MGRSLVLLLLLLALALAAGGCCGLADDYDRLDPDGGRTKLPRVGDLLRGAPSPAQLQAPATYAPVARELALLCQTVPRDLPGGVPLGRAWLPPSVRALGPGFMVSVGPEGANLSWGDRDHPYGYGLKRQPAAGGGARWTLRYADRTANRELTTVALAASQRDADWVPRARAAYDAEVARDPYALGRHRERLFFLLSFAAPAAARAAAADSAARLPAYFWPRLVLALLDAGAGRRAEAARDFTAWVASAPSASRYGYLGHLHRLLGQPDEVCAAMGQALRLPAREERTDMLNGSALGYDLAAYAYREGRLACAADVAGALAEREPDRYTRARFALLFRSVRAAAWFQAGRRAEAAALVRAEGLEERDPFYRRPESTLPRLAQAILAGDAAFVRAWRPEEAEHFDGAVFGGVDVPALAGVRPR